MTSRQRLLLIAGLALCALAAVFVALYPASSETPVESESTRIVAGMVTDEGDSPLAGAEVGIAGRPEVYNTNAAGAFSFSISEGHPDKFLNLRVAKNGFVTRTFNVAPPVQNLKVQLSRKP